MPDNVNWGVLQPLSSMSDIKTAQPQAQGAPAAPVPQTGDAAMGQLQQLQTDKQRLQMEQQRQPGLLQAQQLENQGRGLQNQLTQSQLAAGKYAVQVRSAASDAYMKESARSGPIAGLNSAYDIMAKMGDVDSASKGLGFVEDARQKIKEGRIGDVITQGDQAHGIMMEAQRQNTTPLNVYANAYPGLKKANPDLPDPATFKDNDQFEDTFIKSSLGAAAPYKTAAAAKTKADTGSSLADAQDDIEEQQLKLKQAIKSYGSNSSEAQNAAQQLQNLQVNAARLARGGVGGTLGSLRNFATTPGQIDTGVLIQQNAQSPGQTAPQAAPVAANPATPQAAPASQGKVWTLGPDGKLQ